MVENHKPKSATALVLGKSDHQLGLRDQVLSFINSHPEQPLSEIAKAFEISEKTIRAWKAHQTRGTYSAKEDGKRLKENLISENDNQCNELVHKNRNFTKKANELDGKTWLRYSISVWNDIRKSKEEMKLNHPAMFPVQLPKRLIEIYTNDSMKVVLDPFMGSGSTLIAAMELNKQGIGFEISSEYAQLARERLKNLKLFSMNIQPIIYQEDARKILEYLAENSVDICITSPPYWDILSENRSADNKEIKDYEEKKNNLSVIKSYEEFNRELSKIFEKVYRVLKPGAYCCVNVMDIRKKDKFYAFHSDVANFMQEIGFIFDDLIIWDRRQEYNDLRPLGYPFVFRINRVHEFILIFRKVK